MAMETVVFAYTDPTSGVVTSKTIKAPEWANQDSSDPQQRVLRSLGGQLYVYNRGPYLRKFEFTFEYLDDEQRSKVEDFFDKTNRACRWWSLTFAPGNREVLRAGAATPALRNVLSQDIVAGATYAAGDRILQALVTFRVKLLNPELVFEEVETGFFNLKLTLEVLEGDFLPSNLC